MSRTTVDSNVFHGPIEFEITRVNCNSKCKCNYPEFIEMINDFDILCLVETKTDVCDIINIPGYTVKMKNLLFYVV
jgi:hypothetical protein